MPANLWRWWGMPWRSLGRFATEPVLYLRLLQPACHPCAPPACTSLPAQAWCPVDPDGSRYLLGDRLGGLHLLVLAHDGAGRVSGLRVEPLGEAAVGGPGWGGLP